MSVDRPPLQGELPLRRAALIHKAEAFLLETLTAGYQLDEIESALRMAMDRWRSLAARTNPRPPTGLPAYLAFQRLPRSGAHLAGRPLPRDRSRL